MRIERAAVTRLDCAHFALAVALVWMGLIIAYPRQEVFRQVIRLAGFTLAGAATVLAIAAAWFGR